MSEEVLITEADLLEWINRLPSNDDLDLANFISSRLKKFYELEQETKRLKNIINELEEWLIEYQKETDKYRKMHEMYSDSENRLSSRYFTLGTVLEKMKEIKEKE